MMETGRVTRARVLRGAPAALGAGLLSACGANATGGGTQAGAGATPSPAARPTSLLLSNDWTSPDRRAIIEAWVARANRIHPQIKTELVDNADTQEKIIAQFAADQQGDLVMVDQHLVPVFGPKGVLEDISSTMAALKFDFNSVYDIANITSYGGKRHGILVQLNSNVWVYNKNLFQQAGVAEPTAGWTWNDHLEAARKLSKPDQGQWGMNVRADVYPWFWQAGVDYLAPDGKKTLFDSGPARRHLAARGGRWSCATARPPPSRSSRPSGPPSRPAASPPPCSPHPGSPSPSRSTASSSGR